MAMKRIANCAVCKATMNTNHPKATKMIHPFVHLGIINPYEANKAAEKADKENQ